MNLNEKEKAILFSAAVQYFRDPADEDYILARVNYRLGLLNQFQWSALQAIEKYLKAILIFNSLSTKGLSHKISEALKRVETQITAFTIPLSESERRFINHIHKFGLNRYIEKESYSLGDELFLLDSTVWTLRQYCQNLKGSLEDAKGNTIDLLEINLKSLNRPLYKNKPHKFKLPGGYLEKILKRPKDDLLRKSLIWKNQKYGSNRKSIKQFTFKSFSVTPLHINYPEHKELLQQFIKLD